MSVQFKQASHSCIKQETPKIPKLTWKRQWKSQQTLTQQPKNKISTQQTVSTPRSTLFDEMLCTSSVFQNHSARSFNQISAEKLNKSCADQSAHRCEQLSSQSQQQQQQQHQRQSYLSSSKVTTTPMESKEKNNSKSLGARKRKLDELLSDKSENSQHIAVRTNLKVRKLENGKLTQHPRVKNALLYVF
jgi:hypothetical protein